MATFGAGVVSLSEMGGSGLVELSAPPTSGSSVGVTVGVTGESGDFFFIERTLILHHKNKYKVYTLQHIP